MDRRFLFGIFDDIADVEALLANLSEADFLLGDVSVVAKDAKKARALHDDVGPLQGTDPDLLFSSLLPYGVSEDKAHVYQDAIGQGKVLVGMQVDDVASDAASEMFTDNNGKDVDLV